MSNSVVFIFSLLLSMLTLLVERGVGISWDYHPDAITYTQKYLPTVEHIFDGNLLMVFNHFYYVLSFILGGSVIYLTIVNVFFYALTNVLIADYFRKNAKVYTIFTFCLFLFVMLNPYRLHLSVHVLKDTIIILFTVSIVVFSHLYLRTLSIISLLLFRLVGVLYLFSLYKIKNIKILSIFLFFVFIILLLKGEAIFSFIEGQNNTDMSFRDFDTIPTFQNYGLFGVVIRAFVWPLLIISGAYAFISPSFAYLAVASGSILMQVWCFLVYRKPCYQIQCLILMAILSMLAPGFTSYLRYTVPIMVIMPLVMLRDEK